MITKSVTIYEAVAFGVAYAFVWVDELFDIPHYIFGTVATPVNWSEAVLESTFILALGIAVIILTRYYLRSITYLEGLLPVCAACKRICEGGKWVPIESYIKDHSAADFTHGLCPECIKEHYGDLHDEE